MKSLICTAALIAFCLAKAIWLWVVWLTVVGALALIGAWRVAFVWRNRTGG